MLLRDFALVNPDAIWLRELQGDIDKEVPGRNQVVVYESNHHAGVVFNRRVRDWEPDFEPIPSTAECPTFVYADGMPLAPVTGFGTSLTDSAVVQLDQMTPKQIASLFAFHFGLCRMQFVRVPMGSCDFSLRQYSFVDDKVQPTAIKPLDWLKAHEVEQPEDERRSAWLKQITSQFPATSLLLAPWTAPPLFKSPPKKAWYAWSAPTTPGYVAGALLPQYYELWAHALLRYTLHYAQVRGFKVRALSVQNEPRQLPWPVGQTWETMFFDKDELARFTKLVADLSDLPQYASLNLKLVIGDDQRSKLTDFFVPSLRLVPKHKIWAVGVHAYQYPGWSLPDGTRQRMPAPIVVTEFCTGFSRFLSWPLGRELNGTKHAAQYMRELMASFKNGQITGYVDWNLILNKVGGPNPYNNFVDSLSWFDEETKELKVSYMACMFAHVAAFSGTHVCHSTTDGPYPPLVVSFCDEKRIFVTVFNDGWMFTGNCFHPHYKRRLYYGRAEQGGLWDELHRVRGPKIHTSAATTHKIARDQFTIKTVDLPGLTRNVYYNPLTVSNDNVDDNNNDNQLELLVHTKSNQNAHQFTMDSQGDELIFMQRFPTPARTRSIHRMSTNELLLNLETDLAILDLQSSQQCPLELGNKSIFSALELTSTTVWCGTENSSLHLLDRRQPDLAAQELRVSEEIRKVYAIRTCTNFVAVAATHGVLVFDQRSAARPLIELLFDGDVKALTWSRAKPGHLFCGGGLADPRLLCVDVSRNHVRRKTKLDRQITGLLALDRPSRYGRDQEVLVATQGYLTNDAFHKDPLVTISKGAVSVHSIGDLDMLMQQTFTERILSCVALHHGNFFAATDDDKGLLMNTACKKQQDWLASSNFGLRIR